MEILVLVAIIGLIPATIAHGKGKSFFLWWLYGMALWIVATPHALLMKREQRALDGRALMDGQKKCPYCAEMIRQEATVCRFCQREQP